MKRHFLLITTFAALAGVLAFFFLPNPTTDPDRALGGHIAMGASVAISLLQLAALWYFIASLKTFKLDLRKAYYWLSAGLLIFSLGQLQLPFTFIIQNAGIWLAYILILSPFLFGPLVMYLGVRRFARLLKVHSFWARIWVALGVALMGSAIPTVMLLIVFGVVESQIAITLGLVTWGGGFALAGGILAFKIQNSLSPAYHLAIKRLGVAMIALAFSCLHEVIARGTLGALDASAWYAQLNLSVWPFLVTALLMLWAALSFRAVTKQYSSLAENSSELDVVIHTAELVSIPTEIDDTMDKVRLLTASHSSGEFTEADKKALADVYLELENYLINKEPLRKFSRDDLRSRLSANFIKLLPEQA